MLITLIEKVYQFLWGDLVYIPLPGGGSLRDFPSHLISDTCRHLFFCTYTASACSAVSGYGESPNREKDS